MTPMMARVLSQALLIVVGGSSWVIGISQSEGSPPDQNETLANLTQDLPTDTDYYYDEAEVPNAMSPRMSAPLQRQNMTGPTRPRDDLSSPPNSSGAPTPDLTLRRQTFRGESWPNRLGIPPFGTSTRLR